MPTIASLGRRRPRIAFVLSGGGNLGAIQVGQLRALAERGIVPDVVIGCSIGALNGAAFAADPTSDGVAHIEEIWRSLGDDAESVMPGSFLPNPVQLLRRGHALHSNDGLRRTIDAFLGGRTTFDQLAVPLEVVATDVDAATEAWFDTGPLIDPILASAALPAVYPVVTIGGRRFLDGGVLNNVPIARAVQAGARTIYVLHVGLHGRPNPDVRRPIDAALIAYWIGRNGRFARDLAELPRRIEAIVLPPGARPELRFDDFRRTDELITQGFDHASAHLDALDAADAADARRSDTIGADLLATIDELRGKVIGRWAGHGPRPTPTERPMIDDETADLIDELVRNRAPSDAQVASASDD